MKNSMMRRAFLKQSGIYGSLAFRELLLPKAVWESSRPGQSIYIRKDITRLTDAEIEVFRRGVREMQRRPSSDPTSWIFQANIHGTNDRPAHRAWNQCSHGGYLFLAWHRMYLYYFERILRAASGDSTFSLPYWNYETTREVSGGMSSSRLPRPFREPNNSATNPLYILQRDPFINEGGGLWLSATETNHLFTRDMLFRFSSATAISGSSSFGGFATDHTHRGAGRGAVEQTPHNEVHINIGGWMSDSNMAARDPIFWLHHSNIDRLWRAWQLVDRRIFLGGAPRRFDPYNSRWLESSFTFYDERGSEVSLTGRQIVNTETQLQYKYDNDPQVLSVRGVFSERITQERTVIGDNVRGLLVGTTPAHASIPFNTSAQKVLGKLSTTKTGDMPSVDVILNLEDIEFAERPGIYFEVYLNLPEGNDDPNYRSAHYVGNLSFFGAERSQGKEKMSASFVISRPILKLMAAKRWRSKEVTVTFVGRGVITREGKPAPISPNIKVQIGKLSLISE